MHAENKRTVECGLEVPVQTLIFNLRSSFFVTDFDNVAKALIEREEHMKNMLSELEKKAESVEKEKDLLFLENQKFDKALIEREKHMKKMLNELEKKAESAEKEKDLLFLENQNFNNEARALIEREEHMKKMLYELEKKAESAEKEKDLLFLENQNFNNEARALIEREEQMKKMLNELKKKAESVEKEKDLLFLENQNFNNQARALIEREEQMKKMLNELKKMAESVEKEKDLLYSKNQNFNNVAKALIEREEHMKKMISELEKKAESVEKEKDLLSSENQNLIDESKKSQKELDALRKENLGYKDQMIKVLNSENCWVLKKLSLEDELRKKQCEVNAMRKLNAELMVYKKHFFRFGNSVLSLDKTGEEYLMGLRGSSSINLKNAQQKKSAAESNRPPLFSEKGTEPKPNDVEGGLSTLKRSRVSTEIKKVCDVDSIPTGTQRRKIHRELHNQPLPSHPASAPPGFMPNVVKLATKHDHVSFLDNSGSSSVPNLEKIHGENRSIIDKMKTRKGKWEFEADMLKDFDKDDELCMNAICALHRQNIRGKLFSSRVHVNLGYDLSRIAQLARLLTDGNPQGKLKKTASELNPADLDDCRRFSKRHSGHIFNIYEKKDDPFFPPSRS